MGRAGEGDSTATVCRGFRELDALQKTGGGPLFDAAVWLYSSETGKADEMAILDQFTRLTDNLVLIPAAGADASRRRPRLVLQLAERGFFPDYDSDVAEIEPAAVQMGRRKADSAEILLPAVETGFSHINAELRRLRRTLQTRMSELEAADRHIAQLEEKVLKLKETKRDLKQLKAEKQALRKSPERKIGQVILAPYRLPQKLIQRSTQASRSRRKKKANAANEYQKWFERHRVTPQRGRRDARRSTRLSVTTADQYHYAGL